MQPRVLVVDDDPTFCLLVSERLSKLSAEVETVENSALAWRKLSQQPYQLVIADLEMPGMTGEELIRCIRGHPRTRHLPIIVISAQNSAGPIQNALEAGATSFVSKPVNWTMFDNHIQLHLGLHQTQKQESRRENTTLRA